MSLKEYNGVHGYMYIGNQRDSVIGLCYKEGERYACTTNIGVNENGFHIYTDKHSIPALDENAMFVQVEGSGWGIQAGEVLIVCEIVVSKILSYIEVMNATDMDSSCKYRRPIARLDSDGNFHRDEKYGPAVITATGDQKWYYHGKLHRINGPAIIYSDGRRKWYRHGQLLSIDNGSITGTYL